MIKADANSLMELNRKLRSSCQKFLLDTNAIFEAELAVDQGLKGDSKAASFRSKMNGVKIARADVEDLIIEATREIDEIITIIQRYDSIKF